MIDIKFDEAHVFTHSEKELCVGVWHHTKGKFKGPVNGPDAFVIFPDRSTALAFHEQMEMMLRIGEWANTEDV